MSGGREPKANIGRLGDVKVADIPLRVATQTYQVLNSPSAIDPHTQVGTNKYMSFNPYEATEAQDTFDGGYGLRRYTDYRGDPQRAHTMIKEADGVDCRNDVVILSPAITAETLPSSTGDVIWMGEWTIAGVTRLYAVCAFTGQCLYRRELNGSWTQMAATTLGTPLQGAVGIFNGNLLLGYGAGHTAQYTTDGTVLNNVTDSAAAILYVYAYTADHAAAYIAGGPAAVDVNWVQASTDGHTFDTASIVLCGTADWPITALAPGMGVATVMVGKQNELGLIDLGGTGAGLALPPAYRVLIPFDTRWPGNNVGMHWWQSHGEDEQRGIPVLWFVKDRDPWLYTPDTQNSGKAEIIAPWAQPDMRPPTVRGTPGAAAGTGRWLYYSVTNTQLGKTWLLARDSRTGISTPYCPLGSITKARALGVTGLYGNNPLMIVPQGNNVGKIILPLDSEFPPDDLNCIYQLQGTLDLPDADLGYPLEPKVLDTAVVNADNLYPLNRRVRVQASYDGAAYVTVGTADRQIGTEIPFDPPADGSGDTKPTVRRVGTRLILSTSDTSQTPQLTGFGIRMWINSRHLKAWRFDAIVPAGSTIFPSDDMSNPHSVIGQLWALMDNGTPIEFVDMEGDQHFAHILDVQQVNSSREADAYPNFVIRCTLIEVPGFVGTSQYLTWQLPQDADIVWTPTAFFPFGPPDYPVITPSSLIVIPSTFLDNQHSETVYPKFTIFGPVSNLQLIGTNLFILNYEIKAGEIVFIDMDPVKATVINNEGQDLASHVLGSIWGILPGGGNLSGLAYFANQDSQVQVTWTPY